MRLLEVCVIVAVKWYLLGAVTSRNDSTQYFIMSPSNSSHNISEESDNFFATFSCSTRSGDAPLWIVNEVSVNTIRNTSGYSSIHYELYGLREDGHVLSFLFIPVSAQTNNSVIVCAAIGNGEPLAFSEPAYLVVIHKSIVPVLISTTSPITTQASDGALSTEHYKILSEQWVAGIVITVCLVIGLFVVLSFTGIILSLQRRQKLRQRKELHRAVVENIYCSKERAVMPALEDNPEDFKKT